MEGSVQGSTSHEVEAVAEALWNDTTARWSEPVPFAQAGKSRETYLHDARVAVAALDAVRRSPDDLEARQRDIDERNLAWLRKHHPNDPRVRRRDSAAGAIEGGRLMQDLMQDEDHEPAPLSAEDNERAAEFEWQASRLAQGEDHEAGIEAAADPIEESYGHGGPDDLRAQRRAKAVEVAEQAIAAYLFRCPSPERDTEKLVEAVKDTLCDDEPCSRCRHLREALAEFSEASKGQ